MVTDDGKKIRSTRRTLALATVLTAAVAGVVTTGIVFTGASASAAIDARSAAQMPSALTQPGYYSLAYSPDIWYYSGTGSPYHVSFAQWKAAGYPKPIPAPTQYGQVPGDGQIWAQTQFGSGNASLLVSPMTFNTWAKAGYPKPTVTDPTPAFARNVVQWDGSSDVYYASATAAEPWKKITFATWQQLGSPTPLNLVDQAVTKLKWSDTVSQMSSLSAGQGVVLSFAAWAHLGAPTPTEVAGYVGQRFCTRGGSDVYYYGGGINGIKLTFQQWVAAGAPSPTRC
ncbi:hypothetical protein JT358_01125 [Micrococcales bacterium 31B]|nr:hypothetical protein [Micrococcales bacterium 31B]